MQYPSTRTVDHVDTYHGVDVADPYRWLEDATSEETAAWVAAQNEVTFAHLRRLPTRDALRARLTELWNYERYGLPWRDGGRTFFTRNAGLQNQAVLYVVDGDGAAPRVLLDPNTLSDDGTVALSGVNVSDDGRWLAYAIASAGSDWLEWRVRDVATGADRDDLIRWAKFTGANWDHAGEGFYYSRYDAPADGVAYQQVNLNHKLYYHRLGDDQSADRLVYERPDHPDWNIGGSVTEDGRWLVVGAYQGTDPRNRVFLQDLTREGSAIEPFLSEGDASYRPIGNDGGVFYVVTDHSAPNKRIVAIDAANPAPDAWREILPEAPEALQSASLFGDQLIVTYLQDARTVVRRFDLSGAALGEIALPGIGTAGGFGGRRDDTETFYAFSGYTHPTTIYRYDIASGKSTLYRAPEAAFDPAQFETQQVFVTSKDGTRVPMFLTYKKGLALDGSNPVYLYGYGGFTASLTPGFSVSAIVWMEQGGVYAVANLRGGGEYGEAWHQAGIKTRKQNVFDDFIACAEWLIANGYTRPQKLAIAGGSNGGLLVGACMTQRPELFGAAVPAVGVMDMLRFHRFTIGWAWVSDYGSVDDPDEFAALRAYSPYHNLKPGVRYPATLVTTSDHDDRVVPAHSFKFAAALQAAQAPDGPPTLIRVEVRAGHGAGKPTAKVIEEQADVFAFLSDALGM